MSRSTKRSRVAAGDASGDDGACNVSRSCIEAVAEPADTNNNDVVSCTTANDFSSDVVANILSYLKLREIMCKRGVCKKWTEAVMKTAVSPEENFVVDGVKTYNAMRVMSTVLPNLQSVRLNNFQNCVHKYSDGEDPDEEYAARTVNWRTHDIEIISAFRKLRRLEINYPEMNGRYPFLFNFPLLQKLSITSKNLKVIKFLKWDLGMLAGLPVLTELECELNHSLTGNLRSLRVLKHTLEKVTFENCPNVEGNFMDLADFPQLKTLHLHDTSVTGDIGNIFSGDFSKLEKLVYIDEGSTSGISGDIRSLRVLKNTLDELCIQQCPNVTGSFMDLADFPQLGILHLQYTSVTGDIRDIGNSDFLNLEEVICLPKHIYGGCGYELQRISDAPEVMRTLYLLKKQRPSLVLNYWFCELSEDSPDWYGGEEDVPPPFCVNFVEAGTRVGYRWADSRGEQPCEVNWLDPEPDKGSSDYEEFLDDLQQIEYEGDFYRGYHQPPTVDEYYDIVHELDSQGVI